MTIVAAILLAAAAAGDSREDIARKLDAKISINLRTARLADALEIFRSATGLNFVTVDGAETAVSLAVRDVSVRSALRLLLASADLGAAVENGAVVIRNRRALATSVTLKVYDVRTTLAQLQDFPGPDIALAGGHRCLCMCFHDPGVSGVSPDDLVDLLRIHTGGNSWDQNPRASITFRGGLLYVTQTPRVHQEIETLLARLRF